MDGAVGARNVSWTVRSPVSVRTYVQPDMIATLITCCGFGALQHVRRELGKARP